MHVKLVKVQGDFVWHHHDYEDELFLITKGSLTMKMKNEEGRHDVVVNAGEFIIIPANLEHCPCTADECEIILLEPKGTLNTGNIQDHELTKKDLGTVV